MAVRERGGSGWWPARGRRALGGDAGGRRVCGGAGPAPFVAASWRAGLVASLLGWSPAGAHAQSRDDGPTPQAYRRVAQACVADYTRLCPAAERTGLQPRAMVICLKPYKMSLSLSCRGAVKAVSP